MKASSPCSCCLLNTSDRDLKTPYNRLGRTEIFSQMLAECFQIHLTLDNEEYGICSVCVGRLQDASDFKLQVQRSQAELRVRLERSLSTKDGGVTLKTEIVEDVEAADDILIMGRAIGAGSSSIRTYARRPQPATSCPVRLESRGDKAPLACQMCPKTFDLESKLATHVKEHDNKFGIRAENTSPFPHQKLNTFRYDNCNKEKRKKNLEKRNHHDHNKCFCDICGKQFKRKKYLAGHMKIHMGRKLFACEICNKKFINKQSLSTHKITHTGLKQFSCEECDKKFTLKTNLIKHRKLHTGHKPFTCDICGTQYLRKYSLMLHIRTHTKQRPYGCDICNKKFATTSSLFRHIKTHTGQKPFSCDICKKHFTRKAHLNKHGRCHTSHVTQS